MKYLSTRGGDAGVSFKESVLMGLARDGGLLLPEEYPVVTDRFAQWRQLAYPALAAEIIKLYADDIPTADLEKIVAQSYAGFDDPSVAPVRPLGDQFLLELFHGPTLAFKDFALQFLGRLFEYILAESGQELNLLAATSGDTGSAAIHGIRGKKNLRIFVLHPFGRVSPLQERQMTTVLDDNVFNLAIEGTFDDCQNIVKSLFRDLQFRDACRLGAVNSINWARVLAQTAYYFFAAFRVMEKTGAEKVRFSVPTGNFGDVFAGYVAWRMGLPVEKLIVATNENDILSRYFATGEYSTGGVAQTLSPSMDIQVASNFERYLYHLAGNNPQTVRGWMTDFEQKGVLRTAGYKPDEVFAAGVATTEDTLATIKDYHSKVGIILDPHTAVGVHVAGQYFCDRIPTICLATAHPAKFPDPIRKALAEDGMAKHPTLEKLHDLPRRVERLPASAEKVKAFLQQNIPVAIGGPER